MVRICLVYILILSLWSCSKKKKELRIATGLEGGVIHAMGELMVSSLKEEGWNLQNVPAGDPLYEIREGKADLAIIGNEIKVSAERLRVIIPVSKDILMILYNGEKFVAPPRTVAELITKKKVLILSEEAYGTIPDLLAHYDAYESDYTKIEFDLSNIYTIKDAFEVIDTNDHDVLIFFANITFPIFDPLTERGYQLFSIESLEKIGNGGTIDAYTMKNPLFQPFIIPEKMFNNPDPIATVSSYSILVANKDLSSELIYDLTKDLVNKLSVMAKDITAFYYADVSFDRTKISLPLHKGSIKYLNRDSPSFFERYAELIGVIFSITVVMFGALKAITSERHRKKRDLLDTYIENALNIKNKNREVIDEGQLTSAISQLNQQLEEALILVTQEKITADSRLIVYSNLVKDTITEFRNLIEKQN